MKWRFKKPPLSLVVGDSINVEVMSPTLIGAIKACVGMLDRTGLDPGECEQIQALYEALSGESFTIVVKGRIGEYGPPVAYIKAIPPKPQTKK